MSDFRRRAPAYVPRAPCQGRTDPAPARGRPCQHGFTLIELMLVVTIIGILASVAMPSLARARASSLEASAIGSLRALNTAQVSFSASCGGGFYAPTVASLAKAATGSTRAFIGPGFTANTTNREGYKIVFTAGTRAPRAPASCNGLAAGQVVQSYFIAASPLTTGNGAPTRYFGTSSSATIFQSTRRVAAFYTGVARPPAKPIQ